MSEAVITIKNIYLKRKNTFLWIFKILIAAGILYFLINFIEPGRVISVYRESDKLLLLYVFILSLFNIYIQYRKWKLTCNSLLEEKNKKKIFLSLMYGFSAGIFTPARIGEYFGRASAFDRLFSARVTGAAVVDKLFTFLIVAVIGSVSLVFYPGSHYGFYLLLFVIILAVYLFLKNRSGTLTKNAFVEWLSKHKKYTSLVERFYFIKNADRTFIIKSVLLSLIFYSVFIIQFALLAAAFSHQYNITDFMWAGNLVMFSKTIIPSITPGELGVREGASAYFVKQAGGTAAAGFNASVFLFLINIAIPSIIGLILFMKRK